MKTLNNISSNQFADNVFGKIDENFSDIKSAVDTLEQSGGGGGGSTPSANGPYMVALGASTTTDGSGTHTDGTSIYKIISRLINASTYVNRGEGGLKMRGEKGIGTKLVNDTINNNSAADLIFIQAGWNDISVSGSTPELIGNAQDIISYYETNDLGNESSSTYLTNEIYNTSLGCLFRGVLRLLNATNAVIVICSPIFAYSYISTNSNTVTMRELWVPGIRLIAKYFGQTRFTTSEFANWWKRIRYVDCKNCGLTTENKDLYYHDYNDYFTHPNNQGCAIVAHYIVSQFWRNGLYQSVVTYGGGGGTETDPVFKASPAYGITNAKITEWNNKYTKPSGGIPASDLAEGVIPNVNDKQDTLASGENIKTIDGQSVLGSGNIPINDALFGKMYNEGFLQGTYSTNGWAYNMNPVTPQVNKTYVDVETNTIYRYSGSAYVALGAASGGETYEAMSQAEVTAGTGTTARTITPKLLRDNFYTESEVDDKLGQKADVPSLVEVTTAGAVSQALAPNTFYKFSGSLTSLTLTLTAGTGLVVYAGKFTADSSGCTLSLPATVTEAASNDTIEGGKTYEFSIVDNVIVIKEV